MQNTPGAVQTMLTVKEGRQQRLTVTGSRFKIVKTEQGPYLTFKLSDGQADCKGFYQLKEPKRDLLKVAEELGVKQLTLVVKRYKTYFKDNLPFGVELLDYEIVNCGQTKRETSERMWKGVKMEDPISPSNKRMVKMEHSSLENEQGPNDRLENEDQAQNRDHCQETMPERPQSSFDIRAFEKISDLFKSMTGWVLLVRLVDKSYKEFISKSGAYIKLLTLLFIDRTGNTIEASVFSEAAVSYNQRLKEGSVYRISGGAIRETPFTPTGVKSQAPRCSLVLDKNSSVTEVQEEIEDIPVIENNFVRLGNLESAMPEQNYSVVAVIVNIFGQREIEKGDRILVLEGLKIGDPLTQRTLDVSIWNRQIRLGAQMIGQSFLFKNFKLTKYRDHPSLQSSFRSEMIRHSFFDEFEGKHIHYGIEPKTSKSQLKLIRQLCEETKSLGNDTIYSQVRVWLTRVGFDRKWFYLACPKCKKAVGEADRCSNCECPASEAVRKFILQVELADCSGSIWTSSFEEAASCFLNDTPIEYLVALESDDLEAFGNSHRYHQDYLLTIASKKNGLSMRHSIIGQPHKIDSVQQTYHNLSTIAKLKND